MPTLLFLIFIELILYISQWYEHNIRNVLLRSILVIIFFKNIKYEQYIWKRKLFFITFCRNIYIIVEILCSENHHPKFWEFLPSAPVFIASRAVLKFLWSAGLVYCQNRLTQSWSTVIYSVLVVRLYSSVVLFVF